MWWAYCCYECGEHIVVMSVVWHIVVMSCYCCNECGGHIVVMSVVGILLL